MQNQGGPTAVSYVLAANASSQNLLLKFSRQRRLALRKMALEIVRGAKLWLPFSGPQLPMAGGAQPKRTKLRARPQAHPGEKNNDNQIARLPENAMKHPGGEPRWE